MKCSKLVGCTILLFVVIATGLQPTQAKLCSQVPGKLEWPELVGVAARKAGTIIERENKFVNTIVLPVGTPTTKDINCRRVWVFFDHGGRVARTPYVG